MTLIAVHIDKDNKEINMLGDSIGTDKEYNYNIWPKKVFRKQVNKSGKNLDVLIGHTTSFRMVQILMGMEYPEIKYDDLFMYMITDFIDAVMNEFTKKGYMHTKQGDGQNGEKFGGAFIVAIHDQAFLISENFSVFPIQEFDACGCAAKYFKGAFRAYLNSHPCKSRFLLNEAAIVSRKFSCGISEPFYIETIKY